MINIPDETKQLIQEYMNSYRCPRTLTGYGILLKIIYIAVDDELYSEEINCEEIFRDYTDRVYSGASNDNNLWKAPYRAARYCILKSSFEPTEFGRYSIPAFIQDGRDYVLNAKKERSKKKVSERRGLVRSEV